VRFDASDVHFVAEYGCPVAHCPASNAKLGHGIAPLVELLAAGAVVGLGSDSVASNNRMDLLDEARHAVLLQRARTARHDAIDARRALELATLGGARALGIDDRVGSLEAGKDADLAAFRLDEPRGVSAGDVESTLVFSLAGRPAWLVTVAGRELVRDGRLRGADPALGDRVTATTDRLRVWSACG
jgi:5-methylthioadenosine/S-adenosylhomocysteine deaminase